VSGVAGMPLPGWAPELRPCGTPAAYRRHLRRGEPVDESCRQAAARDWRDGAAGRRVRRRRRLSRVHLDGPGRCYREDVIITGDPERVTCLHCREGYRRCRWVRAAKGQRSSAA
jgi:hypothetical protein